MSDDPPAGELAVRAWKLIGELAIDDDRRAEVAEAIGISFIRSKALRRIAANPSTLTELVRLLQTDAPYMTLVVRDLEERGLVMRTANPADGRSKVVTATSAGHRAAALAESILDRPPRGITDLSDSDLTSLLAILERAAG